MARIWSSGFELNSLTAGVEITSTSIAGTATLTIDTGTVRSGTYSLKAANAGANANAYMAYQFSSTNQNGPYFFRTYIRIAADTAGTTSFIILTDTTTARKAQIKLTAGRVLQLFDSTSQIGSDSSALNLNQWYRVEIDYNNNTVSGKLELDARIDGVSFASTTTSTNTATIAKIELGPHESTSWSIFYDDVALNDNSGSFQNTWPGAGAIIHLKPSAAGDSNGFLVAVGGTGGAGNNFGRVNETPPDDATTYNGSAVLNAEDLFNADNSGLASSDTVNVVSVGVRMADLVGADATAAFKVEVEKTASGTKSQSGTLVPNSTTWLTNAAATPKNYPLTTYQDPDSSAWTQTTLDSMQIGYILTTTNVQTIAVSNVWALVDYTVAPPTTSTSTTTTSTSTTSTSRTTSTSTTSTSSSTSTSTSTTSTSSSTSISTTSTSSSTSTTSTSKSTSTSTTSTSSSTSTSTTSTSSSTSTTSTSSSTSTSTTSTSSSTSTSTTSTSLSTSTSTTSTSSSTSTSTSTSTTVSNTTSTSITTSSSTTQTIPYSFRVD